MNQPKKEGGDSMSLKNFLLACVVFSLAMFIIPNKAVASATGSQDNSTVGVYLVKGNPVPPEPVPPSPIIHKDKIIPTGYLPQTGSFDSPIMFFTGALLTLIIGTAWGYLHFQKKKEGAVFDGKIS